MKVVLVGYDVAPSQALERVGKELSASGVDVCLFLGNGKPIKNAYDAQLIAEHPCVVLCGLSSSKEFAKDEIATAEVAMQMGMPFGFYADTYGTINRPWFAHLREKASFIFVINEEEGEKARELYPNAKVIVSGNPMWEDFFTPKLSREEVRRKLEVGDEEQMVLCPGGKSPAVNILHWGSVIEALSLDQDSLMPRKWKVFLSPHPGDKPAALLKQIAKLKEERLKTLPLSLELTKEITLIDEILKIVEDSYLTKYQELVKYSARVPVRVVTKDFMSASDMVPGADFVIDSGSTVAIEAACQRIPVITNLWEITLARLKETSGSRNWEPCELDVAAMVEGDPHGLLKTINILSRDSEEMKTRQEAVYPAPPEKGAAVRKMVETLMEMSKK